MNLETKYGVSVDILFSYFARYCFKSSYNEGWDYEHNVEVMIIPYKTWCEWTHIQIINKVASLLQTC